MRSFILPAGALCIALSPIALANDQEPMSMDVQMARESTDARELMYMDVQMARERMDAHERLMYMDVRMARERMDARERPEFTDEFPLEDCSFDP